MYTIYDLDTPSLIVDIDVMDANLIRLQNYCDHYGIGLRPHIKTHKIPAFAQKQMDLGTVADPLATPHPKANLFTHQCLDPTLIQQRVTESTSRKDSAICTTILRAVSRFASASL